MLTGLGKAVRHFFPDLNRWMGSLLDTRRQELCVYDRRFLTWMGILVFLLKLGSKRSIRFELSTAEALRNLNHLAGTTQQTIAHQDTLEHFLGHVSPRELDTKLRRNMIRRLVRMKALDHGRLLGHFVIVFDGTGMLVFPERHCAHCLKKTVQGKTIYYHHVLEAKVVTPGGLALSVGSEFIENSDPHATKQDCELKAFARLAHRLNKDFPQLLICLGLDAIYANGAVLDLCRRYRWKYFITFKKGSMPAVWREYQTLLDLCPENRKSVELRDGRRQEYAWVHDLSYEDDQGRQQTFHAFQCQEQQDGQRQFFAWITNFTVCAENVAALGNRGGRLRWNIENQGFNMQKNGGFALEHAYSLGTQQIKGFYILMQVAHLLLQLLEHGDLLGADCRQLYGSLKALAKRLSEALRNYLFPPDALDPAVRIRVRLDSSKAFCCRPALTRTRPFPRRCLRAAPRPMPLVRLAGALRRPLPRPGPRRPSCSSRLKSRVSG